MAENDLSRLLEQVWPDWRTESFLGSGSYGEVYRIRRNNSFRSVSALKFIRLREDGDTAADELKREIESMDALRGAPNIVGIEDYVFVPGENAVLIRMECLHPLSEFYPMEEGRVLDLGIDICTALEVCASHGICHRDIKPSNILVSDYGVYKLGDFGVSRILESGEESMTMACGTPNYMAPEVIQSGHYDSRADQYSLGLVLYTLLNEQKLPFLPMNKQLVSIKDRETARERRLSGEELPPAVHASAELWRIIARACAYEPGKRYADASEMKRDLLRLRDWREGRLPGKAAAGESKLRQFLKTAALLLGAGLFAFGGFFAASRVDSLRTPKTVPEIPSVTQEPGIPEVLPAETETEPDAADAAAPYLIYEISEDGSHAIVTGMRDSTVESVVIPASFGGLPVTEIGEKAFYKTSIVTVELPDTLEIIGGRAFANSSLTALHLPASVRELRLDEYSFSILHSCHHVESLTVDPANPVYYDSGNCIIERETGTLLLGGCRSVIPNDGSIRVIEDSAFGDVQLSLASKTLVIPEGVVRIGDASFECTNCQSLSLPSTLEEIHTWAFNFATDIRNITVAEGNPYYYVQDGCLIDRRSKKLVLAAVGYVIPDDGSVVELERGLFGYWKFLTEISVPDCVIDLNQNTFAKTGLREFRVPASVTKLKYELFKDCEQLTCVVLPAGIREIQNYTFDGCTALREIDFCGTEEEWNRIEIDWVGNESLQNAEIVFDYREE